MGVSETVEGMAREADSALYLLSVLCVFLSVALAVVFKIIRRSKSNAPPSPPKLPFIGNLHQLGTLPHRSLQALSCKYGPLLLLHMGQVPTLLVSSANMAAEIVRAHDVVFSNRPHTTADGLFFYGYKAVAFCNYGFKQKRKICVLELLSTKSVHSVQLICIEEVTEMICSISEASASGRPYVDLSELLIALSNNVMCRCVLGHKYDAPDGSRSFGEVGRKLLSQFTAFCVGDFFPSLGWVDVLTGRIRMFKTTLGSIDVFFDQVIAEHKAKMKKGEDEGQSGKKDFMDILLQLEEAGMLGIDLSQDNLKALLVDIFIGEGDTSSTTMEWAMAELMKNPNTMEKVQEEVRRVVGNKAEVDENDVKQMNYLKCVVKETLRLHPPAPLLLPREIAFAVKLKGYDIPAKTTVILNGWAIQRDPEIWDKPDEFLPERLQDSEKGMPWNGVCHHFD
ncbi:LOW QUALITY PROTEIN: hypothetical protein Fmac_026132 [Flemingia macrophylla]|uniref:Cytochrome P450 71A1 n=1 Tax=Flemingia macrophylla TaxID=520843 RepID=A0ABD1LEJ6_9FABA